MSKRWIATVFASVLAGCASLGPLGTAEFEPTLRRDIPGIEGKLIYQAPGALLYGVDGYAFTDVLFLKVPDKHRYALGEGIVALTDRRLYFVKWAEDRYQSHWDLDYSRVLSIEVRSFGAGRRLVMKLDGTPPIASLDIASDGGQRIDPQRTMAVCQLIAERSGKRCDERGNDDAGSR